MKRFLKNIKRIWNKLNTKNKIFLITILVAILILIAILIANLISKKETQPADSETKQQEESPQEEIKKINIINLESNTRPFAVMINNHSKARPLQSGLQDAYIIYEIIVEGGLTRYLAVFKDQNLSRIGSVRSSRHYFLDYAMENDALYVHWGYSPQAQSQINTFKINNLNGLVYGYEPYFITDNSLKVSREHKRFTSTDGLNALADKLGYRKTSDKKTLLNYQVESVNLANDESAKIANNVTIRYSASVTDKYVYDAENKVYLRFVNDKEHTDYVTKKQYTFKNIITYQVPNHSIDKYGRQDITNVGSGDGYYISEGYAIPIKWEKESRDKQTVYKKLDGTELNVNDGNTFIQIQPTNQKITITE